MHTFSIIPASGRLIAWWASFLRLSTGRPTPMLCPYGEVVIAVEPAVADGIEIITHRRFPIARPNLPQGLAATLLSLIYLGYFVF
jgi:hypothetical protein